MKAIFNSRLTDIESIKLSITNRAFCYGDGLFETIVTGPSRINLMDFHLERLNKACEVMNMHHPTLNSEKLSELILQLTDVNKLKGNIRVKLQVWRYTGGLYTPTAKSSSFLVEVSETNKPIFRRLDEIGISETSSVHFTKISFAKTMSSLPYVLAGIEGQQKGWDDIVLLNSEGHVAETHASNIFWVKNNKIFTSPIATGCIAGIMRRFILTQLRVEEVMAKPTDLLMADAIFSTNASGISYFSRIGANQLKSPEPILQNLIKQLQQP